MSSSNLPEFVSQMLKYINSRVEETGEDPFAVLDEFKQMLKDFMDKHPEKSYRLQTNGRFVSIVALEE